MKYINITIAIIISVMMLSIYQYKKVEKKPYTIAIIQSASHPALDSARDGFLEKIKKYFSKKDQNVEFLFYNTQGSLANAQSLASQLCQNKNINLFFTIGSSVTQAIYQKEKTRPVLFAAVSDINAIGINKSETEDGNICGVSDAIAPEIPYHIIKEIYPAAKKIALLYSLSTLNKKECQKIREHLESKGKEVIDIIVNNETEMESILESNINKVDAIISPCDNIVATSMPVIVKKAIYYKKPFFACFNEATTGGALASCGTNYYESGVKVATYAIQIIEQNSLKGLPVSEINTNNTIYVNKKTACSLGIDIANIKNNNIIIE